MLEPTETEPETLHLHPARRPWRRRRVHRFRHLHRRPRHRAVDRVRRRRQHQDRIHFSLRLLSIPILALVPASYHAIEFPLDLVIAPTLALMGILLLFGRTR